MRHLIVCSLVALMALFATSSNLSAGGAVPGEKIDPSASQALKECMRQFGILMSGVEILKIKEKKPDWATIDITLSQMEKTLAKMQALDKTSAYKPYTDLLEAGLADLKKMSQRRDPAIYSGFGNLSQTCFGCHAAHRPQDFLAPKRSKPTAHSP